MKRIAFITVLFCLLLVSCDDPLTDYDITYSVTAGPGIATANIKYLDENEEVHVLAAEPLPATISIVNSPSGKAWIWAQNNSDNFTDYLTVSMMAEGKYWGPSDSKVGAYCIAEASYQFHIEK